MTSDVRRELMSLLAEVWNMSPDVRLGQLLAHLGFLGEAHVGHGLGDIDDDELMAILQRHKGELESRSQSSPITALPSGSQGISVSGSSISLDPSSPVEPGR